MFEILANVGLQSEYYSRVPKNLYNIQDTLLPTKFLLSGDQELNININPQDIDADIWLAPEGTDAFAVSTDMTKADGGRIKVPHDEGTYRLYLVDGDSKSEPSKGEIIVSDGNFIENVEEGGSYRTSLANPFKVQLKDDYIKEALLNGKKISSGYGITEEGDQELIITDLNDSNISIKFSMYIELVDKVFAKNAVKNWGESVKLGESNNETHAWFVPEEMEILSIAQLVESDQMTKSSDVNANVIDTPKTPGKYVLYLVNGDEISGPSEAVLTVATSEFSVTEGLVARFNADDIETGEGEQLDKWNDLVGGYSLLQNEEKKQPTMKKTALGMKYVEFDGQTSEMIMDSSQVLDLNGKSNLSIVTFSAFTGTDPESYTYGDTKCTVYFGESGSWGSTYLSSYGGFIASRFGSGQEGNYIKTVREKQNNDFVMTAMVKDKETEYLYDDGKKIATVTGKYEQTKNNKTTMMVGKTASGTPSYFQGGISEILIYDRTLSEEEISNLQSYMMTKYYLSQLNPILEEAQGILYEEGAEDKYNSNSWKNLQDSYDQAILIKEQVVDGEKVVAESVKAACENLRNAIDSMQEVITAIPEDNLSLWLKADEGVVKGEDGRVNVWQDSSGAGHNAIIAQNPQDGENLTTPELAENGYNGKPVVRFNGTSDGMQFPFGNIDKTSEATVVIISSSKSDKEETYGGDNIPLLYFHEYGGGWSKFVVTPTSGNVNARFGSGRSDDNGGFMCYERPHNIGEDFSTTVAVKSGSDETIYVGDQEVMSRSNGSATFTNVKDDIGYLGRYPVGSNTTYWYNQSDIAEIMIYNRALGLVEIQQINAYINSKYNISVELASISLEEPAKTEYTIGEELDLEGLKVTAHYSDGSSKELEQEAYEVSGFDSTKAGEKTVTVTYDGKSAEFKVMIKEVAAPAELTSISLEGPAKTQYIIGEELDLEGLKVIAHYSDGSSIELEQEAYEVRGFDSTEAGEKTVTVTCEGVSAEFKVMVKEVETPAELTAISLEGPEKTEYLVGEELDLEGLKVTAHYSDGSSKEVEQEAYEISGFDSTKAGEKTVTVTYEGLNAEFKVMVNIIEIPLISISLDQTNVELTSGSELKLTVLFNPDNTTDPKGIEWSSSNEDIATVEDGTVYAIMKGETTITALVGDKSATCKVIVIEDPEEPVIVTGIVLDKEHIFFSEKGAKAQLEAQIMPENATNKNIIWSSDNNGVATVESGIITAISNGTAIITAESEDGGLKAFCKVEVKIPPATIEVREVKINKSQITLKPGQTERIAAELIPENATDKTVKWTSSNRNVVIVENDGTIKAIQSGVATITASSLNGKTAKCTVTVKEPEKGYISFQDGGYSLYVTESKQTKIIKNVAAGNITGYRSDNPKVATVSSKGIIKGVSKGATYIHVTTDKGISASVKVKVNVPKIKLNYTKLPLQIKKSTNKLKVTSKIKTDYVKSWRSKDKKVATVDKKGKIIAHKVGSATIEVTMKSGAKASCVIKVQKKQVKVTKLLINKTKISLKKGKTFKLVVTKVPVTAGDKITFSTSNKKVATVTSKGKIRGIKKGVVKIYIKASGGKKRSCKVTIN